MHPETGESKNYTYFNSREHYFLTILADEEDGNACVSHQYMYEEKRAEDLNACLLQKYNRSLRETRLARWPEVPVHALAGPGSTSLSCAAAVCDVIQEKDDPDQDTGNDDVDVHEQDVQARV